MTTIKISRLPSRQSSLTEAAKSLTVAAIGCVLVIGCSAAERDPRLPVGTGHADGPMVGVGGAGGASGDGAAGGGPRVPYVDPDGQWEQVDCAGGGKTTISGKIYNPSGAVPLFNVIVYVPTGPLEPLSEGVDCDRCGAAVKAVTATLTDTSGSFVLDDAPVGENVPVVMQVGKWRRQVSLNVQQCQDNALPTELSHLPRNKSEGELPKIAIATGGFDSLECFLRTMGIADSEVTRPEEDGRVHLYQGYGNQWSFGFTDGASLVGGTSRATELWSSEDTLSRYDMVLLSCEGSENMHLKPAASLDAMNRYLNKGGRVFASHYHYVWFKEGPEPMPQTATWTSVPGSTSSPFTIDESHFRGQAFADWLVNVGASPTRGQINLTQVQNNVGDVDLLMSTPWIYKDSPRSVKYFSFNTPANELPEGQCGRAVYTDLHISGVSLGNFPGSCPSGGQLSPQEKALMFLLFDLSSCIDVEDRPPVIPPIDGPS